MARKTKKPIASAAISATSPPISTARLTRSRAACCIKRLPATARHAVRSHHHALTVAAHHHLMEFAGGDLIGQNDHRAQADGDDEREGEHEFPEETQFHHSQPCH